MSLCNHYVVVVSDARCCYSLVDEVTKEAVLQSVQNKDAAGPAAVLSQSTVPRDAIEPSKYTIFQELL